jgi:hypothetical protein
MRLRTLCGSGTRVTCAMALLASLLTSSRSHADDAHKAIDHLVDRPHIAVMGVNAPSLDRQVIEALEETLDTAVTETSKNDVVGPADVRALMNLAAYQQLAGCEDVACARDISSVLAVQRIITCSVQVVGNKRVVDLRFLDLVNNTTIKKVTFESDASMDMLIKQATRAVPALFGYVGSLEIWNQPTEAEAFLDGRPLGKTPVGRIDVREPGTHVLSIVGPGVTPWKERVDVAPGTSVRVRAQNHKLIDVEAERATWDIAGATLTGAGVVSGAFAGWFYFLARRNDQRLDGIDLRSTRQADIDAITDTTLGNLVASVTTGVIGVVGLATGVGALLFNPARGELAVALGNAE